MAPRTPPIAKQTRTRSCFWQPQLIQKTSHEFLAIATTGEQHSTIDSQVSGPTSLCNENLIPENMENLTVWLSSFGSATHQHLFLMPSKSSTIGFWECIKATSLSPASTNQSINEAMSPCTIGSISEWINECVNVWSHESTTWITKVKLFRETSKKNKQIMNNTDYRQYKIKRIHQTYFLSVLGGSAEWAKPS